MQLGIFAKTFSRPTLEAILDEVVRHDLNCIQFNLACAGLPSLPEAIDPGLLNQIRAGCEARQIRIAAVSGTFNMAHPDPKIRAVGLRRLKTLAAACQEMGTSIITLCTGSRDPQDMWRWHPENTSSAAWRDMVATISAAIEISAPMGITLAFEPERANVVYSARRARALLQAISSPYLKVVLDPANLIDGGDQAAIPEIINEAFDLLSEDIVLAHAKDRGPDDGFRAAGKGVLNYSVYLNRLAALHFQGALIIHGLEEGEVDPALQFLKTILAGISGPSQTGSVDRKEPIK